MLLPLSSSALLFPAVRATCLGPGCPTGTNRKEDMVPRPSRGRAQSPVPPARLGLSSGSQGPGHPCPGCHRQDAARTALPLALTYLTGRSVAVWSNQGEKRGTVWHLQAPLPPDLGPGARAASGLPTLLSLPTIGAASICLGMLFRGLTQSPDPGALAVGEDRSHRQWEERDWATCSSLGRAETMASRLSLSSHCPEP